MNGNVLGLACSLALAGLCLWLAWALKRKYRL